MRKFLIVASSLAVIIILFAGCGKNNGNGSSFSYIEDPLDIDENSEISPILLKNSLRVMTFNINAHFSDIEENMDQPYPKVWQRRREGSVQMFLDKLPDLCFIEEFMGNQANYLKDQIGHKYTFHLVQQKTTSQYYLGVMYNAERLQLKKVTPKWFSYNPDVPYQGFDPENSSNVKCAALCEFRDKKTGKTFYAIGAHFVPDGSEREICARLAAQWAEEIAGKDKPVLVMGDLNIRPDDSMLKPLYDVMYDAVDSADYSDGRENFTYNRYGVTPQKNLDHIFYRNLDCITYRVVNNPKAYCINYLSDHNPIFSDIKLK